MVLRVASVLAQGKLMLSSNRLSLDKRVQPAVRRAQTDLVQSWYRYLYTYNKFALAQQTYMLLASKK